MQVTTSNYFFIRIFEGKLVKTFYVAFFVQDNPYYITPYIYVYVTKWIGFKVNEQQRKYGLQNNRREIQIDNPNIKYIY